MSQNYEPLHHKYRPKNLDELIGQDLIKDTLKQAIIASKIAPAYIFCGPRGTGKTSSARIFAKTLNCQNIKAANSSPCEKCDMCESITLGNALDIVEIDAASNTGVENIRDLIEGSRFAPVKAKWKIYVIDECHMLSTAAFNALLKTLEEPPKNVIFILATTNPERVLPTIHSRCQRFDFRRIATAIISSHLDDIAKKEKILIDQDAIILISKKSDGGLRDAESMLDQLSLLPPPININYVWNLLGEVPDRELIDLMKTIIDGKIEDLLITTRNMYDNGKDPSTILQGIANIIRDLLLKKKSLSYNEVSATTEEFHAELVSLAKNLNVKTILKWHKSIKGIEYLIKSSSQPRLWLEINLISLINDILDNDSSNSKDQSIKFKEKIHTESSDIRPQATTYIQPKESSNIKPKKSIPYTKSDNKDDSKMESIDIPREYKIEEVWENIISNIGLPSTKMLLAQQAKITSINDQYVDISVASNWFTMIQTRQQLIEEAIKKTLNGKRTLRINSYKEKNMPRAKSTNSVDINHNKTIKASINQNDQIDKAKIINNSNNDKPSSSENLANFFNGQIIDLEN